MSSDKENIELEFFDGEKPETDQQKLYVDITNNLFGYLSCGNRPDEVLIVLLSLISTTIISHFQPENHYELLEDCKELLNEQYKTLAGMHSHFHGNMTKH